MEECIFCKIAGGKLPAEKRFESEGVIAFDSINPVSEYHILITPKKHIETFMELDSSAGEVFPQMIGAAQTLIRRLNLQDGYKLVVNGGRYQSVPHLHWHLLAGKLEDKDNVLNNT